jgi:hypothetical protein
MTNKNNSSDDFDDNPLSSKNALEHQSSLGHNNQGIFVPEEKIREQQWSLFFYRLFGFSFIVLTVIIIILTIISFYVHPGQPNLELLLIEQIIGFILAFILTIVAIILLFSARKIRRGQVYTLEPLLSSENNELDDSPKNSDKPKDNSTE